MRTLRMIVQDIEDKIKEIADKREYVGKRFELLSQAEIEILRTWFINHERKLMALQIERLNYSENKIKEN